MPIVKQEVKTYVNRYLCEETECDGELEWTGRNRFEFGEPVLYIHECNKCGTRRLIEDHCYPEHVEIEEDFEEIPNDEHWVSK